MERLNRDALLLNLLVKMDSQGSWCSETHVQKATYFLQAMLGVPTGFRFILYMHGPFSFELRDELTAMRADELIVLRPRRPYGPSIEQDDNAGPLLNRFPKTLKRYAPQIEFVAEKIGDMNVIELEKLATALFFSDDLHEVPAPQRAKHVHREKPYVSLEDALEAVKTVDEWSHEADELRIKC